MKILEQRNEVTFDVDLKECTWVKAKEMDGRTVRVDAIGINSKSKYGQQAWLVNGSVGINLPSYMVDEVKEILQDKESTDAIKNGDILAKFTKYTTKNGNESCKVTFTLKG